jgi:hypothetical protein
MTSKTAEWLARIVTTIFIVLLTATITAAVWEAGSPTISILLGLTIIVGAVAIIFWLYYIMDKIERN